VCVNKRVYYNIYMYKLASVNSSDVNYRGVLISEGATTQGNTVKANLRYLTNGQ